MNLIFFSQKQGQARHLHLAHPLTLAIAGVLGLAVLAVAFALGVRFGAQGLGLKAQLAEVRDLKQRTQDRVDAVAVRVGEMNAQLIRLEALGKRLTQMANISSRELNFDAPPALGSSESVLLKGSAAQIPDVTQMLDQVERKLEQRDVQLLALENVILSRSLDQAIRPEGRPVLEGYVSSYYGERQDPFSGHEAWHKGIDYAGVRGSQVVSVASGVVSKAESRSGYGNLIEINHGSGYVTRYGHNQRLLVRVGDTVVRGQPIAQMGSTGRSTGPHVHFEVLRNGRHVNPLSFVDP
jgi:murein DD-endopeptidase MepM/ murein hydrolase activator NlpD